MIDPECKKNRETYFKGKEKLDSLPRKYWNHFIGPHGKETDYDHALMWRDNEYDYFVVSLYETDSTANRKILEEGFQKIPPMYNMACISYMKTFLRTKKQTLIEVK